MKYYLIPITEMRYEDSSFVMHKFLKEIYPNLYYLYKKLDDCDECFKKIINVEIEKTLLKNNLPTYFLFTKKGLLNKQTKEFFSGQEFLLPKYYLLDKEVEKSTFIYCLKSLNHKQILTSLTSFLKYININNKVVILPDIKQSFRKKI